MTVKKSLNSIAADTELLVPEFLTKYTGIYGFIVVALLHLVYSLTFPLSVSVTVKLYPYCRSVNAVAVRWQRVFKTKIS